MRGQTFFFAHVCKDMTWNLFRPEYKVPWAGILGACFMSVIESGKLQMMRDWKKRWEREMWLAGKSYLLGGTGKRQTIRPNKTRSKQPWSQISPYLLEVGRYLNRCGAGRWWTWLVSARPLGKCLGTIRIVALIFARRPPNTLKPYRYNGISIGP